MFIYTYQGNKRMKLQSMLYIYVFFSGVDVVADCFSNDTVVEMLHPTGSQLISTISPTPKGATVPRRNTGP